MIQENEKIAMKELIEKYRSNNEKIQKINRALKQARLEQEDIKDKLKVFMKKYSLQNIYTQDGGKVVYQSQMVQTPINRKFIEKRIIELMGDTKGKEFITNLISKREQSKREHLTFRTGKNNQLYV